MSVESWPPGFNMVAQLGFGPMTGAADFALRALDGSVVCAFGEIIADRVVVLRRALEINGQVEGQVTSRRGGSAATVAAMAARYEVPTRFIGHSGTDQVSATMLEDLRQLGVDVKAICKGEPSSVLALQLASGECALIHDLGGRDQLQPDDVADDWLDDVAMLHVNGQNLYYPETRDTFLSVLRRAKQRNIPISFDTAAANLLLDFGMPAFNEFLAEFRPAVLMCNEHEGDVLGLPYVISPNIDVIVEHRSRASTRLYFDGQVDSVSVALAGGYYDYVGCDDSFFGGFLAGWLQGRSLQGAVLQGHESSRFHLESISSSSAPGIGETL